MRKISQKDLKRFADIKERVEESKSKVEALIEEMKAKIEEAIVEANAARDEAYGALDDLVNEAQNYYDEKSDNWRDGDRGQQYADWISQIESARDNIADDVEIDLDQSIDLEPFDTIANALEEGSFPQSPDEC